MSEQIEFDHGDCPHCGASAAEIKKYGDCGCGHLIDDHLDREAQEKSVEVCWCNDGFSRPDPECPECGGSGVHQEMER